MNAAIKEALDALTEYNAIAQSVPSPAPQPTTEQPDWYSQPIDRKQRTAFRAARTEVRNSERDLQRYGLGGEMDAAIKASEPGMMSTLLDPIFDMLQIGQFVTAGTALEIQKNGLGWDALKRAGSEFANALPGLEVDEAARFMGMDFPAATRPSWSEFLKKADPKFFDSEGAGKWSAAVGGFVLDVLLDPMIAVKPLAMLGKVPGVARGATDLVTWAGRTRAGGGFGRKFIKDFDIKQFGREHQMSESAQKFLDLTQKYKIDTANELADVAETATHFAANMTIAERRLVAAFFAQKGPLDNVLAAAAKDADHLALLKAKAQEMGDTFAKYASQDVDAGLLDNAAVISDYITGLVPLKGSGGEKAMDALFRRMGVMGKEMPAQNVGFMGEGAEKLARRTPSFAKRKEYREGLEERLLDAVPTELDAGIIIARRGAESAKARTSRHFIDGVLSDPDIARKVEPDLALVAGRTEDEIFTRLVTEGLENKAARAEAKRLRTVADQFERGIESQGYGLFVPFKGKNIDGIEPAYIMPKPYLKEMGLADKILKGDTSEARHFMNSLMTVQNVWKGYAVFSPGFHMRNMFSNIWLNTLGGVDNPATYIKALRLQRGGGANISVKAGDNVTYKGQEIYELARKHGLIGTGPISKEFGLEAEKELLANLALGRSGKDIAGKIRQAPGMDEILEMSGGGKITRKEFAALIAETSPGVTPMQAAGQIFGPQNVALKINRRVGEAFEHNARITHFIDKMGKGYTPAEAAKSTKKYLYNYSDLTDFERDVMRFAMPFYSWMRFNIPNMFVSLLEKPARFAALSAKPQQMIESLSADWQEIPTPDYFQRLRATRFPKGVSEMLAGANATMLPSEGDVPQTGLQPVYVHADLPFQDINSLNWKDIVSGMTPLAKIIFETTPDKGYSFFLERNIERYPGEPARIAPPFMDEPLTGKTENVLRTLAPTYGKVQRLRERADRGQLAAQLLTEVGGIKAIQVDIDQVNRAKMYKKREVLRNLKMKMRELGQMP